MKTQIKTCLIIFVVVLMLNNESICQIRVFENNNVGINFSTTPSSRLVLNAAGNSAYQAWFFNPGRSTSGGGLATISDPGTGTNAHILNHLSQTNIGTSNYHYGTKSSCYFSTPTSLGRAYGLYGLAGNAQSGLNYGVYGYLYGTTYGAAIFGTINGLGDITLSQQWAGYFRGDVKVENTLWVNATPYYSDEKFKTNISSLESTETISNILKINPIKYNYKQFEVRSTGGDTLKISKYFDESSQLFVKAKYGVIAQELQEIYPDLVYTDGEGNLGVDYIELVPILIKAIQVQQRNIDALEAKINQLSVK